jgi:hypothetical protein
MGDPIVDHAALRPAERARLDALAHAIDRLDAYACRQFTDQFVTEEVRAAQERAIELIGHDSRQWAIQAAVDALTAAGTRAYVDLPAPQQKSPWYLGGVIGIAMGRNQARRDQAADRIRFLATIDRAVVALILWDELEPFDRPALVGPWGAYLDVVE